MLRGEVSRNKGIGRMVPQRVIGAVVVVAVMLSYHPTPVGRQTMVYHQGDPIGAAVHRGGGWIGPLDRATTLWLSCTGRGGWIGPSDRLPGVTGVGQNTPSEAISVHV